MKNRVSLGAKELIELGRTTPPVQRWAPRLEPGALGGWHKNDSITDRRKKLIKLLKKEPCVTVLRRINVIANLTTDKPTETKLRQDYAYVEKNNACRLKKKGSK